MHHQAIIQIVGVWLSTKEGVMCMKYHTVELEDTRC